jgi:hypothetical protein
VVTVTENGRRIRLTKREILVKKLVNAAVNGEYKPLQLLLGFAGAATEPEPVVAVDPAEIARFALRYLGPPAETPSPVVSGDAPDGEDGA